MSGDVDHGGADRRRAVLPQLFPILGVHKGSFNQPMRFAGPGYDIVHVHQGVWYYCGSVPLGSLGGALG